MALKPRTTQSVGSGQANPKQPNLGIRLTIQQAFGCSVVVCVQLIRASLNVNGRVS
jgi:hypothetical protein